MYKLISLVMEVSFLGLVCVSHWFCKLKKLLIKISLKLLLTTINCCHSRSFYIALFRQIIFVGQKGNEIATD